MKIMTRNQEQVLSHIEYGRDNAVSRGALADLTGLRDRSIRRVISELREMGHPIVSSSRHKGYWLTTRRDEMKEFSDYMKAIAKGDFKSSKRIRVCLKTNDDQMAFVGDGNE